MRVIEDVGTLFAKHQIFMTSLMMQILYIFCFCVGRLFYTQIHVFNFLQSKSLFNIKSCIFEIQNLKQNLADLRNDSNVNNFCDEAIILNNLEYADIKRDELRKIIYEILDLLIV